MREDYEVENIRKVKNGFIVVIRDKGYLYKMDVTDGGKFEVICPRIEDVLMCVYKWLVNPSHAETKMFEEALKCHPNTK